MLEYNQFRILEGRNIYGNNCTMVLSFNRAVESGWDIFLENYKNIAEEFNLKTEIEKRRVATEEVDILITFDRLEITRFIVEKLLGECSINEIREEVETMMKEDWMYEIKKICRQKNIPYIKIAEDQLQIGYGSNSCRLCREDSFNNIQQSIDKIENKNKGLIPIISVTGTNGKTTTVRLIHKILLGLGVRSGLSSTGGIYIGEKIIKHGDTTGFYSAREVLKCADVDVAVLETARGGILKKGLGYRKSKVAIITSISEDHIGKGRVNSINDLIDVKSLTCEEVANDGVIILKAVDELYQRYKHRENLILFEYHKNSVIDDHLQNGGVAYYVEEDYIIKAYNGEKEKLISILSIPFTFEGCSKSNVKNVISAMAAIENIGIDLESIIDKIKKVKCNIYTNLGRQNIIEFDRFKLLIDYGHNSEAFHEVFSIANSLPHSKITGLITAAGDREDKYIRELGAITAKYCDKIIIKEQPDLRGRAEGETATLLKLGALDNNFKEDKIKIIQEEGDAIKIALEEAMEDEIIVSFSQFLYLTFPAINEYRKNNNLEPIGEDLNLEH